MREKNYPDSIELLFARLDLTTLLGGACVWLLVADNRLKSLLHSRELYSNTLTPLVQLRGIYLL